MPRQAAEAGSPSLELVSRDVHSAAQFFRLISTADEMDSSIAWISVLLKSSEV